MNKACVECGGEFTKSPSNSKKYWAKKRFCSIKCFGLSLVKEKKEEICSGCGKNFFIPESKLNKTGKYYCSKKCIEFGGWNIGRHHTEETKKIIREKRALQVIPKESYIKRGIKLSGENHHNWKGGRMMAEGYVLVMDKDHPNRSKAGYVREHRLVAEKALGRYLAKTEVIHHINEVKNDNRIENLYLFSRLADHKNYHQLFRLGKVEEITKSNLV